MDDLKTILKNKPILLITENQNTKVSLKKLFTDSGIQSSNILSAETIISAQKLIKQSESHLIVIDYCFEGECSRELIELYKRVNLSAVDNIIAVLSHENSDSLKIDSMEYEFDIVFEAPYSQNDFKNHFSDVISSKLKIGLFERALYEMGGALENEDFDEIEDFLKKFEDKNINDPKFKLFRAKYKNKIGLFDQGISILEDIVTKDETQYKSSVMLFDIYIELNEFAKAYSLIENYLKHYPLHANRIESYIKASLMTKNYQAILNFGLKIEIGMDLSEKTLRAIAAGMIIASSEIKILNRDMAIKACEKALKLSQFSPNIIRSLTIIFECGEPNLVRRYIERLEDYQMNEQLRVLEYRALNKEESGKNVYIKGIELVQDGVVDFDVYDIMIKSAIKVGRKKSSIRETIEDASKHYPEKEAYFSSILK